MKNFSQLQQEYHKIQDVLIDRFLDEEERRKVCGYDPSDCYDNGRRSCSGCNRRRVAA